MSTQLNQMENNLPTTTSKQEFVSPTHDHIIPKRMKKANLFVKSLGILAMILVTGLGVFGQVPTITSFSPSSATVGSTVTITGTGFDAAAANNVVYFGGVRATVDAAISTQLTVTVPSGASYNKISVATGNKIANSSKAFAVTNPCTAPTSFSSFSAFSAAATVASVSGDNGISDVIVAAADFDSDGKVDILKVGQANVSISRNIIASAGDAITNTSFDAAQNFTVGGNLRNVIYSDLNADGKLDVLTAGANGVYYLINNSTSGNISFSSAVQIAGSITNVESNDFDGDGRNDIMTLSGSTLSIYLNTGSGSSVAFGSAYTISLAGASSGMDIGDLDNDGKIDVAVTGSGSTFVYINSSSSGSLSFTNNFSLPYSHTYIEIQDFDADGLNDIILYNNYIRNSFSSGTITSSDFNQNSISVVNEGDSGYSSTDLDGDGYPECFIGTSWDKVHCLINAGTGTPSSLFNAFPSVSRGTAVGADFNGDNKVDFVASMRNFQSNMVVYQNNLSNTGTISVSGSITAFSSCSGIASSAQSTTVSGICLSNNINTAAPTGFEVSLDGSTWANSATITQNSGSASATLYVRMKALSSSPSNGNITLSSTGANSVTIALSGTVNICTSVAATPTSLSGFATCFGTASTHQTTSVSGSGLTANMVLTAPTGYEISLSSGSGFASTLTLTQSSGTVAATTIYVRLSASAAAGAANGNITISSTGASDALVALSGTVNAIPTVTITAPAAICTPSTVDLTAAAVTAGSTASLTYTYWTNSATTTSLTTPAAVTTSGTYYIQGTTAAGCSSTSSVLVTINDPITAVTLAVNQQPCGSSATGSATVTLTGGIATNYAWTKGGVSYTATPSNAPTNLNAGTYIVNVTDACGNTIASNSVTISNVASLSISNVSQTGTILCNGLSTGAITGTITGGGTAARVLTVTNTTTSQAYSSQTPTSGSAATGYTYTVSNLPAGTYTVVASSTVSSCTATASNVTISQPAAIAPNGTPTAACYGLSNGSIAASATGGTAPYTYSIDGTTFQSTTTFTSLASGTYTLTVKDANNCSGTASVVVTQPSTALSVSIATQTNVNCFGQSTGSVTVLGAGGTGTYTYSKNGTNFQASATFSSLSVGTYTITIKDQSNCIATTTVTISEPSTVLAVTSSGTNLTCYNISTGTVSAVATGGTTPYSYSWNSSPAQTSASATGLAAGAYTVTITDNNGCTATSSTTITQPAAYSASISAQTNVDCYGNANGAATVTAIGGTSPYAYSWTGGATTANISNKIAGTYTATVTDANGCTTTAIATITEPVAALAASISTSTNVLCRGNSTGSATVAVTGGTSTYTYSWNSNPVQTTATASGLAAGSYTVTVTDANNCTTTASVSITEPSASLAATITAQTNVLCNAATTGAAEVTATGGTGAFTYSWTGGATTNVISSLAAGTYTATVTDANGCTTTATATITEPTALTVSVASTNACFGTSNGTITVTAAGGTGTLSYSIDNGSTYGSSASLTGLAAGNYDVIVKDANNCTTSAIPVTILAPSAALTASIVGTNVLCNGLSTGAADLSVAGGQSPYTYAWTGPLTFTATSEDLTAIPAGTYNVTITDAYSCTTTASVSITEPSALAIAKTIVNVGCYGLSTGSVDVTVTGGATTYSYNWGGGITTEDLTALSAGTYNLTVTDANACTATTSAVVTQPSAPLAIQVTATNVACFGNATGAIDVTVTGGTAAYTYNWGGGITTEDLTALSAGTYSLTVTDANNCASSTTVTIAQPSAILAVSLALTPATCYQVDDASIASTVTGGTSPYTYAWGGGVTTANISNATQHGTYQVIVTDANGCTVQSNGAYVPQVAQLDATTTITQVSCNGGSNGEILVSNLTGGYGTYAYSWDGTSYTNYTSGTFTNSGLIAGSYTLYLQDAANIGCVRQIALTVTEPNALTIANANTNVSCNGGNNGAINITVSGGTAGYTYNWGGGITTEDLTGLSIGTYAVTVTDANSCIINSANFSITQPTALVITQGAQTNNICYGGTNGAVTVSASGGTAPYTYSSNGTLFQPTGSFTGLAAGSYTLTVKDANNCTSTVSVTITEPNELIVADEGISDASCSNLTDGAIPIGVSGGTGAYSFAWTGPNGFTSTNEDQNYNLAPGIYSVIVTDGNSCSASLSNLVVSSPTSVTITLTSSNVTCFGGSDGSITATVSGGSPAYNFQWKKDGTNYATTQNITGLGTGAYQLVVTDANFCSFSSSSTSISAPNALNASVTAGTASICSGQTATFTLTGTETQVVTYTLNGGLNATATIGVGGTATVTVANATSTQNIAIVSVSNGACANNVTGTASVVVNANPIANAGIDQSVCSGTSVILAATGSDTYSWDNGVTDNVAFTVSNTSSAPISTSYTLTATNSFGCVSTDQVAVSVNPLPGANAGNDVEVCSGTSVNLFGTCDVPTAGNQNGVTNVADANSGDQIGQSFTATTSGTLSNIQLTLWPFGSPYLLVRDYNGSVLANAFGGAIIGTSSVATNMPPVANWQNMSTFEFTNGPALVAGQQYTIEILNYAGAYTGLQDSYAGGESFHTLNAGFAGDMNFVVQVCAPASITTYTWNNNVTNNVAFTASNATTNPITTTYNLTATNQYSCTNTDQVDVTVQPTPVVNQQSNITYCGGNMQPGITFTGTTSNTQYVWTSSQNVGFFSGGTSLASASPSIGGYVIDPVNQEVSTVSVIPQIISGSLTCSGSPMTFTVTVNPTPFVNPVIDQVVCNNGTVAGINLTGTVPTGLNLIAYEGFDYPNNTNISNQSGGIGWAGNWEANYYGNSSMIVNSPGLSYTGLNVTGNKLQWGGPGQYQPHSVRRSVNNPNSGIVYLQFISDFNSSSGGTDRLDLNLAGTTQASFGGNNAQQQMSILAGAQTINSGASVYPLSLVIVQIDYVSNTTKMWVSPTLSSFDYNNPGTPDATYNNAVAFDQVSLTFRSGAQIDEISIYGGPTFNWTNDNTSTGLGASGIGNITSFTGTNTGSSVETSNITVTPTLNGCSGTAETFSITVNPTPTVTQPSDQTVCAGTNFVATNFTGAVSGTNYSWSSSNTAVGLAASGTGNIAAFAATNTTNAPISTTVTVTPTFGETGTTFGETSENGTMTLTAPTGTVFTGVTYASYGNPTGSNGNYTNGSCHSNTSQAVVEGLALGQTSVTINATDAEFGAPCAGTQSLAVVLAYGPACSGTTKTFTLTVNPVPSVMNQTATICSGGTFTVSPTDGSGNLIPTGTTYSWSAPSVTGITGTAAGTYASSISGTLTNTTNAAINVVYTITPSSATTPACDGTSFTVTVTVAPTATVSVQTQTICSGSNFTVTPSNGSGNIVPTGTTYSWSAPTVTGITGTAAGTNASSISGSITNSTNAAITVAYTVTPTSGSCTGTPFTVSIIVNPAPSITPQTTTICSEGVMTYSPSNGSGNIVPTGTTYSWTFADNANVSGEAIGTNQNNIGQTLTNTTNIDQQVVYTVTPTSGTCVGSTFTLTATVNPKPLIADKTQTICSGNAFTIAPINGGSEIVPAGTQYTWTVVNNTNVSGDVNEATAQNTVSQTLTNSTNVAQTVVYTVTPVLTGCSGNPFTVTVTVNPVPVIVNYALNGCSGTTISSTPANGSGNLVPAGTTYTWSLVDNSFVLGEQAESTGQSSFSQSLVNLYTTSQLVNYTVTPSYLSCAGNNFTIAVTVNELPNVAAITGATNVCTGLTTQLASATTGGTWTSSNTAVATVNASGVVTGVTVGNVTISYSVTNANGCTSSVSASVNVNIGTSATITSAGSTTFCQGGSVTLTANSGATYLWSNGAQTQSINVTTGGPYTVMVTNAGGCSVTSSATTVTVNALPTTAAITGSTSLCVGTTTNLATTSVNPTWSSSNTSIATVSATGVVTGVSSGSATISYSITDANGCSNTASSAVVVNPLPTATIAAIGSTTFCQGGSVTLLAANAPSGSTYSYIWNLNGTAIVGATANTYVANASGNYSVTITANGLCQATSSATTVTVNSLPTLAASTGTTSICAGSTTALSNATAAGTWSSSNNAVATINSANGLVTGVTAGSAVMTYTFTNANGCSSSTTTNFTVNPLPTATITASGSTTFCQGGSVTLTANTATSYQWSNGATTASITVNTAGNYTVTITNANGCSAVSVPTTVTVNTLPSATITANGPTTFCQGGNVTLVASSGASYLWSNGAPTQTISVTAAGTYSVTVTSAAGCTATSTGTIVTVNALPVATINPIGSTTFCQGSLVTLIASAGTSYLWSSGETTQGIIASVDGPYTVTVTNANGCSATSANTNVVVYPLPTVAAITGSNDVCVGSTTVLATTSIGGVWSSSNTAVATISPSGVVTGITAGNAVLSYTITNVNGCTNSATAAMTVNAGTTATISTSGTTTFCAGGSVTLTASSGSSYEWNTGSLNPSITVSASGSYYVNVTNALGCTATSVLTQVVVNPLPVVAAISGSTEVCIGNTTQLANTTIGGVWSSSNNNIATVDANGLVTSVTAGSTSITYTVTTANGCTTSVSAVVNVNALPTASISANGATTFCAGGSVTLVATTGTSYLWNNGQFTQSITVDTAGTYFTTVTNASGCSANTNAITVTVNALPTAVVTANGPTTFCQGNNVLLTATGGTNYLWSTGETTQSILVSTSENIQVDVTNSNGCTAAAANTIVTVLPVTVATITANGPTAICLGSNVTLSATAGTGLTYLWSNGVTTATTQNITVSNAGTYSVTVTNASGCSSTATQTVTVNVNPAVTVTANGPTLFCQGGSVTLTATGAASYEWNTGDFTSSITVTTAGSYFVVGTSAAGCETTSATTVVTTSTIPAVAAITGANNVCEGGTINLTSSTINGTWISANNFIATVSNTGIVTGQNAGSTTITYTVTNGACSNAVTAIVNVLNNPVVPIITASGATTMCPGGTVILFASNGASYQWSNGPLTPFITVNQSGDYAVTVTNASGCSATSLPINVFIGDNTNPVIVPPANITMAPNFGCDAIGVNLGNPTATDNCSVATVSHNAPAIFPLGLTTVTWTVVDGSGNTSTATQFVNVVDNILPTINVNDITVVINDNGSTTITFSDVDNGTTDNCGIASMTLSQYTFGCSNIGDNNITVTVTDNNGNVATTTILVTVVTSGTDTDNDGTLNACDSDDDGDGINDVDEVVGDTDGDGIPNSIDADDDGDGISTIIEGTDDIDGDGISNYLDSDSDGDGISDDFEWDFGGLGEPGQDCDNDGVYDFLDTDLCGPVIPEAFTPNGNGFNDNFVIPGIEGYKTRSVSIYSRYGTLVYETSEYNNDWDGTLLNTSTQVPDGTYYYIFTFDNGVVVNGYVYINRVQK